MVRTHLTFSPEITANFMYPIIHIMVRSNIHNEAGWEENIHGQKNYAKGTKNKIMKSIRRLYLYDGWMSTP